MARLRSMLIIPAILCFGAGVLMISGPLILFRTVLGSNRWPATSGKIITSVIEGPFPGKYGLGYKNDIDYAYSVDGNTYVGDQIDPVSVGHDDLGYAQHLASQYPIGKVVTVHYSPTSPGTAVLIPSGLPAHLVLIGMMLVVLSIVWLLVLRRFFGRSAASTQNHVPLRN